MIGLYPSQRRKPKVKPKYYRTSAGPGSRTNRRKLYVAGVLWGRLRLRRGYEGGVSLALDTAKSMRAKPSALAGIRRAYASATGSFKTRKGSWVHGKGGRFVGSK